MVAVGMLPKAPEPGALSSAGRAGDGLTWSLRGAGLRRWPGRPWRPLLTRFGVLALVVALGELHGVQEALVLTLGDGLAKPSSVAP